MKQICPTHHFSYSGSVCPFCERERIERLASKYGRQVVNMKEEETEETPREVTEDDLQKLLSKFNTKKK